MQDTDQAARGRLLCVLLVWLGSLPPDTGGGNQRRKTQLLWMSEIMKSIVIKRLLILSLLLYSLVSQAGETVEVKVSGMFCEMCAYGLQLSLRNLEGVQDAKVDYAGQSCRVEMKEGLVADIEAINKAIADSG